MATRSGASLDGKRRVFVLDIVGAGEKTAGLTVDVSASPGKLSNVALTSNTSMHGLRATFEIDPNDADLIELRLRIMHGSQPVSETWLYRWTAPELRGAPGVPGQRRAACRPRNALSMPPQDLDYAPPRLPMPPASAAVWFARFILLATSLGITTYGVYQMLQVVRFASMTVLQGMMIFFFGVSLAWIAFSAGSVIAGASKRRDPLPDPRAGRQTRTALVMPIYNEDPTRTTAALEAMAESLQRVGGNRAFEIVVLSDSTNADAWIRETAAVERLRHALSTIMPVWYRRRWRNVARKSGNIEEFVSRWGGRYDHMIVLDADSLVDGATLIRLAQMMQADSTLGILQTAPQLVGAATLFGRLQQFAACVYGPVISRGLAAWSGDSANYWGHNAIIRMRAFAQSCGLPELEGRKPFGGHVLSHDFVEAALIRRAGWKVSMTTDCGGSWEESPPSLIDVAIRDRRWAQGNLQHLKMIGARGLSFASRLHLGIGIMSYLSSPLWLLMLCIGFALAVQSHLIRPEYFNHDFQMFPTWPRFNVELMMALFWFSMVVLLVPKFLGLSGPPVLAACAAAAAALSVSARASCSRSCSRRCTHR